jgi:hypothetical protein
LAITVCFRANDGASDKQKEEPGIRSEIMYVRPILGEENQVKRNYRRYKNLGGVKTEFIVVSIGA